MLTKQKWDAFQADQLSKTEIGKFVLCYAKEEDTTRLFIHQFNRWTSAFTKEGWWDTFTVSRKSCANKGFYLCQIEKFRLDKDGYLNMIVFPNKYLGETIDEDATAWDYLNMSGKFTREYKSTQRRSRFNITNLERTFKEKFEESGYPTMESFIFSEFMTSGITLDEISIALEEKYDIEKLADDINKNIEKYAEKYPLLVKKLPKEEFYGHMIYTTSNTVNYLENKSIEYDIHKLGTDNILLNRVEAVLQYWVDVHKAKKEKEKAERKAKKLIKTK